MGKEVLCDDLTFNGEIVPPDTGSVTAGPWASVTTGSCTVASAAGAMVLTLDSTSEVQNACLYQGDVLSYDIDDLESIEFWVKASASLDSSVSVAIGVASARNAAIDSITEAALFRLIGNNTVVVETDDGTNNNDDVATGDTLSTTWKRCVINFKDSTTTVVPGPNLGAPSNVNFRMENSQGLLREVATGTRFDMSNYTGGLQPFVQIQKTSGTATGTLSVRRVKVNYRYA